MKSAANFYIKRLAGLDDYRQLPLQKDGDLYQVGHGLPQWKQQTSRARQKRVRFWPAAIFCAILIMYVLSSHTHRRPDTPTATND
jgi:hypothetical protein